MVSPDQLRKAGCTPEAWKPLFTAKAGDKIKPIKRLEELIQGRVFDGTSRCFAEFRTWAAIDLAHDVSFAQTTPTIIQGMMNRKWDKQEDILAELERWGLKVDDLFLEAKVDGKRGISLNVPTFYKIFVPLVKAYVTIRWAKLYNDRNQSPLFKYEPIQPNAETRVLCEILTYLLQVQTADYGYNTVLKNVIFQSLMYSVCLAFPSEVWDAQYQLDEEGERFLEKEGIRYQLPHPAKMFYDLTYPISTFNTDTGCSFAGYWKVVKYGDILDNPNYWNRRLIGYSSRDWATELTANGLFQELFPCVLTFPACTKDAPAGTGRENNAAFYTTSQRDMAVCETNVFMKIVPSKYKLGTYKYPIWVRFVVASDNTVIYAEPCCYSPVLYCGYDSNALRSRNSSMALEVLPFQDMVGNVLSQILLTIKQNLLTINFYDKNVVDKNQLDDFQNSGELKYRSMNWIGVDSLKLQRSGLPTDLRSAIQQVTFPQKDVNPLFQTINTLLGTLERLLQLSSQESGAAASHQQSAEEVKQTGGATNNRVAFTGSYVDEFIDALKQQQHDAMLAYMDSPVKAMVPSDLPDIEEHLKEIGFDVTTQIKGEGRIKVKGPKMKLKLDAFAVSGKGPERKNDSQVAQVMMQAVMSMAKNKDFMQALGIKPILKVIEKAAILAGADKDFKLRPDQKQELAAMQQMAEKIQIACAKHASDTIAKPAAAAVKKAEGEIQQLQVEIKTLDAAMAKLIKQVSGQPPAPPPNGQPNPIPAPPGPPGGAGAPVAPPSVPGIPPA